MQDVDFSAVDRRSEPIGSRAAKPCAERVLVMRPEGFFSNRFHLEVEERGDSRSHLCEAPDAPRGIERVIDLKLVLMILLIGVPLLAYCVLSFAS